MKPACEPASSSSKPSASPKKSHESCPFAAPLSALERKKNDRSQRSAFLSETSRFAPCNLVSRRGFSRSTPRRPAHPPFPEQIWCLLTGSSPPSRFPRRYTSFGAMTVGTNGPACGFNWQSTANYIGFAVSWSQHIWTPYRLLPSMVQIHPSREVIIPSFSLRNSLWSVHGRTASQKTAKKRKKGSCGLNLPAP